MKKIVSLLFVVVLIGLVSGAVEIDSDSSSLNSDYRVGDSLQGFLNISISDEAVDNKLRFVFGSNEKSVDVKDFLDEHSDVSYTCDPSDCSNDFIVNGGSSTSKEISLSSSSDEVFGFLLNGNDVEVIENGLSFDVSSDAGPNCVSQLEIDISSDDEIDWENSKSLGESCGNDLVSACYDKSSFDSWFVLGDQPYCEIIKIGKAPAFDVKANLKWDGVASYSSDLLVASIYGSDKELKGSCNFGKPSSSGGVKSCKINYVSKTDDEQFVCVSRKIGVNNGGYELKGRIPGNKCGFLGDPGQVSENTADYEIVSKGKKYDAVGKFTFNDEVSISQSGSPLISIVNDYLSERYGSDCPEDGCIVPITLSGLSQDVTMDNINLKYKNSASNQISKDVGYLLSSSPATLDLDFKVINLGVNKISVPDSAGDYTLEVFSGSDKIYMKDISVKEKEATVLEQIHPRTAAAGVNTRFIVFVDSKINVSELTFEWQFDDGSLKKTSSVPFIDHTLPNIKEYKLTVKALKDRQVITSAEFGVSAVAPKDAVGKIIEEYKTRIANVKSKRDLLPVNYQNYVDRQTDIGVIEGNVNDIEAEYLALSQGDVADETVYVTLVNDLLNENIPRDIRVSSSSRKEFIYDLNDLNLEHFTLLFNQGYQTGQEDQYKNAIFKWFFDNIDGEVRHKTYSIYFDDFPRPFVSEFEITITPEYSSDVRGFLIINRDKSEIEFGDSYNTELGSGVTGIEVDLSESSRVKFSLEEEIDAFSLPLYFAPEFSELSIGSAPPKVKKSGLGFWGRFLIGFFLVIIVVFIFYILLQNWYNNKYEKHLFKNKNDLFNLLQFIKNSKDRGMKDDDVKKKLKGAKWKGEQVNYALKRYEGKRIGMWEIPLFPGRKRKKIQDELAKRKTIARI